jgi:hypothetical protein
MKTRIAYILLMRANSSYIKKNYGLKFYQEFKLIANEKLEQLIQEIPDIGNSMFSINYAFVTAYVPFFYAFRQFEETKDKAGELLWLINENLLRIIPVFIWRIAGKIAVSTRNIKVLQKIQKQGELGLMHPMDWRLEIVEHSDQTYSCNMKECGALKVLKELGEDSIFPYTCRIDYLMANLMRIKFERNKTLADGDDCCNNHILGSGFTEWSPEKGFELRK